MLKHLFRGQKCCTVHELSECLKVSHETINSIIKRNKEFLRNDIFVLRGEELKLFKLTEGLYTKANKSLLVIFLHGVEFIKAQLGHTSDGISYMSLRWCKKYESEMKYLIEKVFSKHHDIRYQYHDGDYIYDFLLDNKIVIECDEKAHLHYDEEYENRRTNYIASKGYQLLRYDASKNDMLSFIGEISFALSSKYSPCEA